MLAAAWIAYITVVALLGVYAVHRLYLTTLYWRTRRAVPGPEAVAAPPLPDELPIVTVQLPLFNESCVAGRLIDAVAALDWPIDRLDIQILDDSTDETTALCAARAADLRARGYTVEHLHRTDRTGFKAGALEAGLTRARGELVLVLDADFVPSPVMLREVVGHFADPNVGMVQVRWGHINRDHSALTRVQALLLDGHFVVEQVVRARTGRFFNFNGTAGIWRRAAIADAGGWHHDTLTEDLDLSYRALLAGWDFVYVLGHAAPAELPVDMNAFKSQQYRWAKGSIQVARKLLPSVLRADLPRSVKLEAAFHLTQNVPYLLTLLLVLLSVPALALREDPALWLHVPTLIGTVLTLGAYCITSQTVLGVERWWRVALRLPALIGVTVGICVNQARAVIEGALGHQSPFVRTPKLGDGAGRRRWWRGARYRGVRDLVPIAELVLAAYVAAAAGLVITAGRPTGAPFFALAGIGLAYVGGRSAAGR